MTGFETLTRKGLTLTVGQVLPVDLVLQVGQASQSVDVESAAPLTETQSSSVSQVVNRKMVAGLPMPNRAATSLVALAPGVVMIDTGKERKIIPCSASRAGGRAIRTSHWTEAM